MTSEKSTDEKHVCKFCKLIYFDKPSLKKHICEFYFPGECSNDGKKYDLKELAIPRRFLKKELKKFKKSRVDGEHLTKEYFFCNECQKFFSHKFDFIVHQLKKRKILSELDMCSDCYFNVVTKHCLKIEKSKSKNSEDKVKVNIKKKSHEIFCTRCGTHFENYQELSEHFFDSAHQKSSETNECANFLENNLRDVNFVHRRVENGLVLGITGEEFKFVHEYEQNDSRKQKQAKSLRKSIKLEKQEFYCTGQKYLPSKF